MLATGKVEDVKWTSNRLFFYFIFFVHGSGRTKHKIKSQPHKTTHWKAIFLTVVYLSLSFILLIISRPRYSICLHPGDALNKTDKAKQPKMCKCRKRIEWKCFFKMYNKCIDYTKARSCVCVCVRARARWDMYVCLPRVRQNTEWSLKTYLPRAYIFIEEAYIIAHVRNGHSDTCDWTVSGARFSGNQRSENVAVNRELVGRRLNSSPVIKNTYTEKYTVVWSGLVKSSTEN